MQCEMTFAGTSPWHAMGELCSAKASIRYSIGSVNLDVCGYHARLIAREVCEDRLVVHVKAVALIDGVVGGEVKLGDIARSDGALATTPADEA